MKREQAIDEAINMILRKGISLSKSTDEETGETFISIDNESVYFSETFKNLIAKIETELLWPSGVFDVFFVASEKSSNVQTVVHGVKMPVESGEVLSAAPVAVFSMTDIVKNAIAMPLDQFNQAPDTFRSTVVSIGMNMVFDASEIGVASFATAIWNMPYLQALLMPLPDIMAQNAIVANNAILAKSLDWKFPNHQKLPSQRNS